MDLGLKGRRALVLGGSQGLGFACAKALADDGADVVINGRNLENARAAAKEIGGRAVAGDVGDAETRKVIFETARSLIGEIEILVTNAGGPPPGPFQNHEQKSWMAALQSNMLSAVDFATLALPSMIEGRFGRVVNVTSFTVREPYPNMGLATGVRAGLTGAMASLAREVADKGVTVNNLLPGLMDTGALKRVYAAQSKMQGISEEQAKENMAQSIPMRRLGLAEDFGPMCAFLCSRHASYITGQNVTIDGGLVRSLL